MYEFDFGNLYEYNTSSGVVIPQTSDIKSKVQQAFVRIFGDQFSLDPSTANGRLIDAITTLFVDVCGVNAQNANGFNIIQAGGSMLDELGAIFGIPRNGESDVLYRSRIIKSASRGMGFADSITNAISRVNGVQKVVVLDNGSAHPDALPKNNFGIPQPESIAVAAHSVFICVKGGDDTKITEAIRSTISAGCGYTTDSEYGTVTSKTIVDTDTNTSFTAKFYRPTNRYLKVEVDVNGASYTGSDIISDTKNAILESIIDNSMNSTLTKSSLIASIASLGKNIVCTNQKFTISDTDSTVSTGTEVDSVIVQPYKYIPTGSSDEQGNPDEERIAFLENNIIVHIV